MNKAEATRLLNVFFKHYVDCGDGLTDDEWDIIIRYNKYTVLNHPEQATPDAIKKAGSYNGPVYNYSMLFRDNMSMLIDGDRETWEKEYNDAFNTVKQCKSNCDLFPCQNCSRVWCRCGIERGHVYINLINGIWNRKVYGCDFCLGAAPIFMPHLRSELLLFCPYPDLVSKDSLEKIDHAVRN